MREELNVAPQAAAQMTHLERDLVLDSPLESRAIQFNGRPVWAEVSLAAIVQNMNAIRKHIGQKCKVLAIVKANAYGLGAVPISRALANAGAEWFGVTCTSEGAELREAGIRQRILVLSSFWSGEETQLISYNLTPTVTQIEQLRLLGHAAAKPALRGPRPVFLFTSKSTRE